MTAGRSLEFFGSATAKKILTVGPPQCSYGLPPRCFWTCGFTLSVETRESASQRHPDKRQRRVVHRAALFLGVGLHAAKSRGRGESERARGGGAPTKPLHSRGRSPIFPASRPSFSRVPPDMRLIHMYTWQLCTRIERIPGKPGKHDGLEPGSYGGLRPRA